MTVRWKPLLILSGLFVAVAVLGLMTMAMVMGSRGPGDILARARAERRAKEYDKAKTDYDRALQHDNRNAAVHEEVAEMYDEWSRQAPPEKKAALHTSYLQALGNAASHDAKWPVPKRRLLADAIAQDNVEQARWAKDLLTVEPTNADAHFVLAALALEDNAPNVAEVRRHLKLIEAETPRRIRADWVAARVAELSKDQARLAPILEKSRGLKLTAEADTTDRLALLRLRAMDVAEATDPEALKPRVAALLDEALAAASDREIPPTRIPRITVLLEHAQRTLLGLGITDPSAKDQLTALAESIDKATEAIFQKSLAVEGGAELGVYLAYADHLRFRERRDKCLEVVTQGLKSPAAARNAASETAMGLRALAVESTLGNVADKGRYEAAAPHIKALIECKHDRFQALGHLFQGAIDLEKAGLVADVQTKESSRVEQAKLRASALGHLKIAATRLPQLAEAQARYGVALILSQEPAMGRQYLQHAQRMGSLEPQYQIWAAWSVVQAGYPEDAEPIVARMLQAVEQGRLPRSMEGTLHLLSGEIHQTRRSPDDLRKAVEEYSKAFANGQDATPAVELRLAQIEVMLGRPAEALKRIDWLVGKGKAGPAAEQLAVLTLQEMGREDEARKRLGDARAKYPDSGELAVLDAGLLVKAKKADQADRVLADFLARVPDHVGAIQQRAQILAKELDRAGDARKLLNAVADRGENSAPLVQLALLDLQLRDFDAVAAGIAKIRARWKEASAADLLDAQLALAKQDLAAASAHFDAALKKDPDNKVVQFWKAQLDGRSDPQAAAKVFEALAGEDSIKEIDDGLSLVAASQSALANMAMESGNLDAAITRFRGMLKDGKAGGIARDVRWQLVAAQDAKKDWPAARAEIASLMSDPKSPPSPEERVRAATYHRIHKEDAAALALVETVLASDPGNPGAVVTRAEILTRTGKTPEAIATIQKGIEATSAKGGKSPAVFYLMLAAVETVAPTTEQSYARALAVLDRGLEAAPNSAELVQAKCQLLTKTKGVKAASSFLDDRAKADPKGPYRRMLMSYHREQGDFEAAEKIAADLVKESPTDAAMAVAQIRLVAFQAIQAAQKGDKAEEKKCNDREAALIYEARPRFKNDPTFPQLDGELQLRRGDFARALALTQEVDALAKGSPAGPMLRSQVFAAKGQPREAADALNEALARNPRLTDARLQLAKLNLQSGQADEAVRQAHLVSEADPEERTGKAALLVEARALATRGGSAAQVQEDRARAIKMLAAATRANPRFADAFWLTAEIQMMSQARPQAVAALKESLKANPDDVTALKLAVQILSEPKAPGAAPSAADLAEAKALAKQFAENDARGDRMQAVATGLHQAGQLEEAMPWAEKAAAKLDSPIAHLGLGDLLLSLSEQQADPARSRKYLDRALAEYDKVLAAQPNVVEAVNNKAWILHSYLGKSQEALDLAQGLLQRVGPNALPGEFYDTLGSIQEKLGRPRDAEESYKKGLGKSPDHPVLNFHMGRLMASDKAKARKAADHLKVAQAGSDRLPAPMVAELNTLLRQTVQ